MGLAPLHSWKPDAYGEAPGLLGALLAGGVTNFAFLSVVRVYQVCSAAGEGAFARDALLGLGLLSMALAAVFMVGQRDFKRMLAYSSVEHMGILARGARAGRLGRDRRLLPRRSTTGSPRACSSSPPATSTAPSASKRIDDVRGAARRLPVSGPLFLAGFLAVTGTPALQPVLERVHHPERRHRGRAASWWPASSSSSWRSSSSAWAPPCSTWCRASDEGAPATPGFRDSWLTAGPPLVLLLAVLALGLWLPRPLRRSSRPRPRLVTGSLTMTTRVLQAWNAEAGRRRRRSPSSRSTTSSRSWPTPSPPAAGCRAYFGGAPDGDRDARHRGAGRRRRRGGSASSPRRVGRLLALARRRVPVAPGLRAGALRAVRRAAGGAPLAEAAPLRAARSSPGVDPWGRVGEPTTIPGDYPFFRVEGEEVHEVAVGPVHAGVIEPGHFRFQCHGEHVFHARDRPRLPAPRRRAHARSAGRTGAPVDAPRVGRRRHRGGQRPRPRQRGGGAGRLPDPGRAASVLRGVALELERLANHVGDLGHAGRRRGLPAHRQLLRGAARRLPERAGRDLRQPVRPRPGRARAASASTSTPAPPSRLADKVQKAWEQVEGADAALLRVPLGAQPHRRHRRGRAARPAPQLGLVGPAARACGVSRDVRRDHATGVFRFLHVPVVTGETGDVFARGLGAPARGGAQRRVRGATAPRPARRAGSRRPARRPRPGRLVVSLTEGWRGELCHVVEHRPATGASPATSSWTPPSTTGWGSRWRCAASRSPTSRSATRASTSPTAGTTSDGRHPRHPPVPRRLRPADRRLPRGAGPLPGALPRPPGRSTRALRRRRPRRRGGLPHRGRPRPGRRRRLAIDLGRCTFCGLCEEACPGRHPLHPRLPAGGADAGGAGGERRRAAARRARSTRRRASSSAGRCGCARCRRRAATAARPS